jgi:hypothetical protein
LPKSRDDELQDHLRRAGIGWNLLPERAVIEAEEAWRLIYGQAFQGQPRLRHGAKADHEYLRQPCTHYLLVPFSAGVRELPVHVLGRLLGAYDCRGPLVPLGAFCDVEFFVSPTDFSWTMIHTHEDHALGGPYFIRSEWVGGAEGG